MTRRTANPKAPRTPRVLTRCVANAHAIKHRERIIEFSFPDTPENAGGLIRFLSRVGQADDTGTPRTPLVEVYRTDGQVEVIAPRRRVWVCYGRFRHGGNFCQLYTHEVTAYQWVADDILGLQDEETSRLTRDQLIDLVQGSDGSHGHEWYVEEVETP